MFAATRQYCVDADLESPVPQLYEGYPVLRNKARDERKVDVRVENSDVLKSALSVIKLSPLVLNMANAGTLGGGVAQGARAQEEDIFLSTNYMLTTSATKPWYGARKLDGVAVIVTSRVSVVRHTDGQRNLLPFGRPFNYAQLDFVACAAMRLAEEPKQLTDGDWYSMSWKIAKLLAVARDIGYKTLVLGALGCGAFNNPAHDVAFMFAYLLRNNFAGDFDSVVFAILARPNRANELRNLQVFEKTLNGPHTWNEKYQVWVPPYLVDYVVSK